VANKSLGVNIQLDDISNKAVTCTSNRFGPALDGPLSRNLRSSKWGGVKVDGTIFSSSFSTKQTTSGECESRGPMGPCLDIGPKLNLEVSRRAYEGFIGKILDQPLL
jgi:hypothetical protein